MTQFAVVDRSLFELFRDTPVVSTLKHIALHEYCGEIPPNTSIPLHLDQLAPLALPQPPPHLLRPPSAPRLPLFPPPSPPAAPAPREAASRAVPRPPRLRPAPQPPLPQPRRSHPPLRHPLPRRPILLF